LPGPVFAGADPLLEALLAPAFFVFAMSLSVPAKAMEIFQLCARFPLHDCLYFRGLLGRNVLRQLPESRGARLHGKWAEALNRPPV
jgi:hypothetical protein